MVTKTKKYMNGKLLYCAKIVINIISMIIILFYITDDLFNKFHETQNSINDYTWTIVILLSCIVSLANILYYSLRLFYKEYPSKVFLKQKNKKSILNFLFLALIIYASIIYIIICIINIWFNISFYLTLLAISVYNVFTISVYNIFIGILLTVVSIDIIYSTILVIITLAKKIKKNMNRLKHYL